MYCHLCFWLIFLYFFVYNDIVVAQGIHNVSLPDTVCVGENLKITTPGGGFSYNWDFCLGDLSAIPQVNTLLEFPQGNYPTGMTNIFDGSNFYGFFFSAADGRLYRLDYGQDFLSTPAVVGLGNVGGALNVPIYIKLQKEGANWLALVTNGGDNTLQLLNFGSSLANLSPTVTRVNLPITLSNPRGLEIVRDGNAVYALIANLNSSQISLLNFGSSLMNAPSGFNLVLPGITGANDVAAIHDGTGWYVVVTANPNKVFRISFRNSLSNIFPLVSEIASGNSLLNDPRSVALLRDGNRYWAWLTVKSGSDATLASLDFGISFAQVPVVRSYRNTVIIDPFHAWGMSFLKLSNSTIVGTTASHYSPGSKILQIIFPNTCSASVSTSFEAEPIVSYSTPGKYLTDLILTDTNGNSSVVTDSVVVLSTVAPSVLFTTDSQCTGVATQFSGLSDGVVTSWRWDFGDNTTGSGQNVSHQYVSEGTYRVVLTVKGDGSCTNQYTKMVTIYNSNKPTPRFSVPALLCSNASVQFSDQSVPAVNETIRRWQWDFGDGTTSAEPNPFHEYAQNGVYTVSLSVAGLSGCDSTLSKTIAVQPGVQVNFNFSKVCIGDATAFNNSTESEAVWMWNFGEPTSANNTSTLKNPTHTYAAPGLYMVTLSATTPNGCVVTRRKQIRIGVIPVMDFIYSKVCAAAPVEFTVSSLTSDTPTMAIAWNFGDPESQNNLSAEDSPTHVFTRPGTYSVTLTLTTALGCQGSITKQIELKPSARPDFSLASTCATQPLAFTNSTVAVDNDPINRYVWNFGDNTPVVSVKDPVHTFASPGTYNITLTVYGSQSGCASVITRRVNITALPEVIFSTVPVCNGYTVQFTDNTSLPLGETVRSWEWNFGGQGSSLVQNPQFNFNQPGSYIVSLKLTLASGCSRTLTRNVIVAPRPQADFRFSPNYRAAPMEVTFVNDSRRAIRYQWDFGDAAFSTDAAPRHTYTAIGEYTVTLLAYNEIGCADTIRKTVQVKIPLADVRIRSIAIDNTGGLYTVVADILNTGTIPLSNLELLLTGGNTFGLQEKWTGNLQPDQSFAYPFKAQIVKDYVRELPYVCVLLQKPNGLIDPTPEDNRSCASLLETFSVLPAYPNPSSDGIITIPCILPEVAEVSLKVYDVTGRNVYASLKKDTHPGFNELRVDLAGLNNGLYILQINYQGKAQSQKWVRHR
jgi:PKD repeat protein